METSDQEASREIERRSIAMLPSGAWAMKRESALALYAELANTEQRLTTALMQVEELAEALGQHSS